MPKYIETPEKLWKLFTDYVEHEKSKPMYKTEYVGKDGNMVLTPLQVPITFEGFECYLGDLNIIQDLGDYSCNRDESYTEFIPVIRRIRNNCFVQNFKGASVGLFNHAIIAKKLGLIDKTQNENNNTNRVINIQTISSDSPLSSNEGDIQME
jgi:hypothetical protein